MKNIEAVRFCQTGIALIGLLQGADFKSRDTTQT